MNVWGELEVQVYEEPLQFRDPRDPPHVEFKEPELFSTVHEAAAFYQRWVRRRKASFAAGRMNAFLWIMFSPARTSDELLEANPIPEGNFYYVAETNTFGWSPAVGQQEWARAVSRGRGRPRFPESWLTSNPVLALVQDVAQRQDASKPPLKRVNSIDVWALTSPAKEATDFAARMIWNEGWFDDTRFNASLDLVQMYVDDVANRFGFFVEKRGPGIWLILPLQSNPKTYPGWTKISQNRRKTAIHYRHDASGWELVHCGHPTAIWPYYAIDPAHPDEITVTHNGLGFKDLVTGMRQIEEVLAGDLVATHSRCVPGVQRITTREDDRELPEEGVRLNPSWWPFRRRRKDGRPKLNHLGKAMFSGSAARVGQELEMAGWEQVFSALQHYSWALFAQEDPDENDKKIGHAVFRELFARAYGGAPGVPAIWIQAAQKGPGYFARRLWIAYGIPPLEGERENPLPEPSFVHEVAGDQLGILYAGGPLKAGKTIKAGGRKDEDLFVTQLPHWAKTRGPDVIAYRLPPTARVLYVDALKPEDNPKLLQHVIGFFRGAARAKGELQRFDKDVKLMHSSPAGFIYAVDAYAKALEFDAVFWSPAEISVKNPQVLDQVVTAAIPRDITIGDVATLKINDPDADFWVKRVHGDALKVGIPVDEYRPNHFGVRVKPEWESVFPALNLFQLFRYLHRTGEMKRYTHGTAQQFIRKDWITKMPVGFGR